MLNKVCCQNIDVILVDPDPWVLPRYGFHAFVPEWHGDGYPITLGGRCEMFLGPGLCQLKRESEDPINATQGEHGLLSDDFVLGANVNAPADRGVLAFVIFA